MKEVHQDLIACFRFCCNVNRMIITELICHISSDRTVAHASGVYLYCLEQAYVFDVEVSVRTDPRAVMAVAVSDQAWEGNLKSGL